MKKKFALAAAIALMLTMTACAARTQEETASEEQTTLTATEVEESLAASASDAEEAAQEEPPASGSDAVLDEDTYAAAQACIGRTVEELYDTIGEPTGDSQYASSCAQEDAEDGMLFYDGFYVWTLRTADEEIVQDVYLLD
jgi:triosephosphate isomerase